jgi:hypothetical protein
MFKVDEYIVRFQHIRYAEPLNLVPANRPAIYIQATTICWIAFGDTSKVIGVTYCSIKDQFSYNEGRKKALTRALTNAKFDKATRTRFWQAYFQKRGKVK